MALTENLYTQTVTGTTQFAFNFQYIKDTDVKVSIDGVNTTAYTLVNATTIEFVSAPAVNAAIRIYRDTDTTELNSTFFAGSAVRASDLNDNFQQALFAVQEVVARFIDRTQAIFQNVIDMGGFRITNMGAGTAATDAVNKSQLDATQNYNDTQLANSVTEATTQAGNATTQAGAASASALAAQQSASAASGSASAASDSADDAQGYAANAQASASAAQFFAVDPVFFGFKRAVVGNRTVLRCDFSGATDTTSLHDPNDYFYKEKVTSFLGSNGLINNLNEPKFSYQSNGHVYIQLH